MEWLAWAVFIGSWGTLALAVGVVSAVMWTSIKDCNEREAERLQSRERYRSFAVERCRLLDEYVRYSTAKAKKRYDNFVKAYTECSYADFQERVIDGVWIDEAHIYNQPKDKNMNRTDRIKAAKELIQQAQDELEKAERMSQTWPQEGDMYYEPCMDGGVERYRWDAAGFTGNRRFRGIYRTREEAVLADKKRIVENKIRAIAAEDGWEADWDDRGQWKFMLEYDHKTECWTRNSNNFLHRQGTIYMSAAAAKRCIMEIDSDELDALL